MDEAEFHPVELAQTKADLPEASEFRNLDLLPMRNAISKSNTTTIIIDNREAGRKMTIDVDQQTNSEALILYNPLGEDLLRLGMLLLQTPNNIHYVKLYGTESVAISCLLNVFGRRPLEKLYLKGVSEKFVLNIKNYENVAKTVVFINCLHTDDLAKAATSISSWAIASDDEDEAQSKRSFRRR